MSNYPDSVLKRAGYKTTRDTRDKNVKKTCPFCPKEFVFTCYGPHIFRHHMDQLFRGNSKLCITNKKNLTCKKAFHEPLPLEVGETEEVYSCLGCQSIFQKSATAMNHFKNKKSSCSELHQTNILTLKDKYPMTEEETAPGGSTIPNKSKLIFFVESLIERMRELEFKHGEEKMDYERRFSCFFKDWGMDLREEVLSKDWAFVEKPAEPLSPVTSPLTEEEEELLPLVQEKSLTHEEVMKKLLTEKVIEENSISLRTGQKIVVPEIEQMKQVLGHQSTQHTQPKPQTSAVPIRRGPKRTDDQPAPVITPVITPAPAPAPAPEPVPDAKDEKIKQMEAQLAEMDSFQKMTPWQKFLKSNPGLSVQEQLKIASSLGIRPDNNTGLKIVSNTKR